MAAGVPLRIFTAEASGGRHLCDGDDQEGDAVLHRVFRGALLAAETRSDRDARIREGAMEDWGLISYSENAILFDPARSHSTRRNVFNIVAHEIAHQWFGNLVTAASWDEIWLNEAFATWMENKASGAVQSRMA